MTRPIATSSAETAARYHVARERIRRSPPLGAPPVYSGDGIEIPRHKRRILIDLAPDTVALLLRACRYEMASQPELVSTSMRANEKMLVEALEKAR